MAHLFTAEKLRERERELARLRSTCLPELVRMLYEVSRVWSPPSPEGAHHKMNTPVLCGTTSISTSSNPVTCHSQRRPSS